MFGRCWGRGRGGRADDQRGGVGEPARVMAPPTLGGRTSQSVVPGQADGHVTGLAVRGDQIGRLVTGLARRRVLRCVYASGHWVRPRRREATQL